jgi:hypothetical protein
VLKELSIDVAPILKIIFKRSYDTGDLPDIWKNANVSPIFKKGKRFEAVNYRPISLIGQRRNLKSRLFKELNQPIDYTPKYTFKS